MKCIIFCKLFPYIFINYVVRLSGNSRLNTLHFYYVVQFFSPKVLSSPVVVIKFLHFDRSVLWLVTLGVETLNHTVCKTMYTFSLQQFRIVIHSHTNYKMKTLNENTFNFPEGMKTLFIYLCYCFENTKLSQ